MKLNLILSGLASALLLTASPVVAQSADESVATPAPVATAEGETCNFFTCALENVRFGNPIDPSTWWDGSEESGHHEMLVDMNPADIKSWMQIIDPDTHSAVHMTLTNPEGWAQFMKPEFVFDMFAMENVTNMIDLETYEPLIDPQTYAYWAQPGAYGHVLNVSHYAELINPQAYVNLFSDVAGAWMGMVDG